jgi:hypothetical protein
LTMPLDSLTAAPPAPETPASSDVNATLTPQGATAPPAENPQK